MDYLLGVDLAQTSDFTALVVLERTKQTAPPTRAYSYAVRHLERLPLGTPYPAQAARVKELHDRLKGEGHAVKLVVDQTGVGRPVVDMLRAAKLSPVAVTITGGDSASRDRLGYKVPKRDLVSTVQVLLQSERLKIAKELKEAQTLINELLAFRVTISSGGHDSYGNDWRQNAHDDMVLATALACWYGERHTPPARPITFGDFPHESIFTDHFISREG